MKIDGNEYKIRDLMREAVIIQKDAELVQVLESLIKGKSNIGVVVDTEGRYLGSVNTVDVIRAILPDYIEEDPTAARFADTEMLREDTKKSATKSVSDFISKKDLTMHANANLLEAAVLSSVNAQGRTVIVDEDNKPLGILTRTEIKQVLGAFLDIKNDLEDFCSTGNC